MADTSVILLPPPPHRKHTLVFFLLALLVLAGMFGGLVLYFAAQIPRPVTTIYDVVSYAAPQDWQTCDNSAEGYVVKYPPVWAAACAGADVAFVTVAGQKVLMEITTKDTGLIRAQLGKKIAPAATEEDVFAAWAGSRKEISYATIGNSNFALFKIDERKTYAAIHSGKLYELSFADGIDPSVLGVILSSFTFTK